MVYRCVQLLLPPVQAMQDLEITFPPQPAFPRTGGRWCENALVLVSLGWSTCLWKAGGRFQKKRGRCCSSRPLPVALMKKLSNITWRVEERNRKRQDLRAESARAFTGRRCPHSGRGEDFLTGQLNFFMKTAVTPERKVEKSISRWEMNRHAEGYKWVIDQNWGRMAKIGFLDQRLRFWAQKKGFTSVP